MTQVIIYKNEVGGVSVCIPTGEISIDDVLAKDCPVGSIIVDSSALPADNQWFSAWELNDSTVTVNLDKAKLIALEKVNTEAKKEYAQRQTNVAIGIENNVSDADWLASINAKRNAINSASSIDELNV
jgi:hypothetical protein